MTYQIFRKDAVDFLNGLEPGSVHMIGTDTAYESLEKHRKVGTTTRLKKSDASSNAWFDIFKNERFPEYFEASYRALAKNAHHYFMSDQETMFVARPAGEAAGFKWWKAIIWDKMRKGMGYHYRYQQEMIQFFEKGNLQHELVLFFEKGKLKVNDLSVSDVLHVPMINRRDKYPTEKPPELFEILIRQSTKPGDLVVDPFMGSGAVGVAAIRLGRRFIGNDTSAKAILLASERLELAERVAQNAAVAT